MRSIADLVIWVIAAILNVTLVAVFSIVIITIGLVAAAIILLAIIICILFILADKVITFFKSLFRRNYACS